MSDEMPESLTPTDPAIPSPLVTRVLDEAGALLGMREQDGDNWGPVVRLVAAPFVSPERLATFAPDQKRAGKLLWCALFVSYCWWKAWPEFKPFADSECSDLWEKHTAQGWTWIKTVAIGDLETREGNSLDEVRDRRYHMSETQVYGFSRPRPVAGDLPADGLPGPGDIVFFIELDRKGQPLFKDGKPKLRHVGLTKRHVQPARPVA